MSDIILRLSRNVPMLRTAQRSLREVKRVHSVPSCLAKTRDLYHITNVCSRLRAVTCPFLPSTTNHHPSPQTKNKSPAHPMTLHQRLLLLLLDILLKVRIVGYI